MSAHRESVQGETPSVDQWVEALTAGDPHKRHRAMHRVGDQQIRDARVVPILIRALGDPDPEFRCVAAWALGRLRCANALDALKAAARDASWHVRTMAAVAVKEIEKAPEQFVPLAELTQSNPPIEVVEPSPARVQAPVQLPKRADQPVLDPSDRIAGSGLPLALVAPSLPSSPSHTERRRGACVPAVPRTRPRLDSARVRQLVTHDADPRDHVVSEELFAEYSETGLFRVLERMALAYEVKHRNEIEAVEPQAVAVGKELNARGGLVAMLRVFRRLPDGPGKRRLVRLWHGIGPWVA